MPQTEEELIDLAREGRPIHSIGSGTKRHYGPAAAESAQTVCLRNLRKITSYEPGDLVVTVQAGARLTDLQAELAKHDQWLPIDPPHADATIGGILATNSSGPRRFAYGTMRDHLLGMRVMGEKGSLTRSGGRVVKNVTGFDLHKLHIGTLGSLGIITEANFKLRPRPEISAAIVFSCASVQEAHTLLLKVFDSKLRPVALEALDGRLRHVIDAPALAIVGVEGSRPVLDRHVRELQAMGRAMNLLDGKLLWDALRDGPERLKNVVRVRIGARPHDLPQLLPSAPLWIQAGTGIARVDLDPAPDVAHRVREWNGKAAALGGYAVVESAPLDMAGRAGLPWGGPENPLMKAIKEMRDRGRQLNPGREAV
jgi:glycolate oxidase FAD binding subunit